MVDSTVFAERVVYINTRQHAENRLYTLLHECGHVLVDSTRNGDRVYKLSGQAWSEARDRPSQAKRVAMLTEEIEAWKRGERLALRLGIAIDKTKYDLARTMALMTYVRWAAP